MPHIDLLVLVTLVATFGVCARLQWRRGARGRRLAAGLAAGFHGSALVVMLAGHCVDILYSVAVGNRSPDGSVFAYNWRTYSLLLFGVLLVRAGVDALRIAMRLAAGDTAAHADHRRLVALVLAIVAPTIPLHGIFGWAISGLSALAAATVALAARSRAAAPLPVAATSAA
jgi:hypothetical protein